jgi:hypothetical protein
MGPVGQRAVSMDLEATAPTVLAGGIVLAVVILSVAVAIVIVRGSWSAKEPDRYALRVLSGLPQWLWPWSGRDARARPRSVRRDLVKKG